MKKYFIVFSILLVALICWAAPKKVTFAWDYPTNELSTDLTFILYHSTNITLPLTNWVPVTNIIGTNLTLSIDIEPGQHFYYLTASNMWGESDPCNVVGTPHTPKNIYNLTIQKQ